MKNDLLVRWARYVRGASAALTAVVCACALGGTPLQSMEPTKPPASSDRTPVSLLSEKNEGETTYMNACRIKGVPIPPDWHVSSSEWVAHGNLRTILLTPNHLEAVQPDDTTFAGVWSYAHPTVRGACVALGRSSGTFEVICQSAETGYACFWRNDPFSPDSRWTRDTSSVPLSSLHDPERGFAPGTVACTECHRGTNAFLVAPDDPTWATVLRPAVPRPTFTMLVDRSPASEPSTAGSTVTPRPRFIPLGGKAVALSNPVPTSQGCSGACHELHDEILKKGHTAEGYVRIPRPMGPNCARTSPDHDPTRDCYR
ncbi:MAG: hypothetical protein NNA31_06635 [Nitrospira sp.]|nr:hypothetical protein [Nitrospira sp.]